MTLNDFALAIREEICQFDGPQLTQNTDIVDDSEAIFHFERGEILVTVDRTGQIHAFANFGPSMIWRIEPRPMDLASARLVAEFFVTRAGAAD